MGAQIPVEVPHRRVFPAVVVDGKQHLSAADGIPDGKEDGRFCVQLSPGADGPESDSHAGHRQVFYRFRIIALKDDVGREAGALAEAVAESPDQPGFVQADEIFVGHVGETHVGLGGEPGGGGHRHEKFFFQHHGVVVADRKAADDRGDGDVDEIVRFFLGQDKADIRPDGFIADDAVGHVGGGGHKVQPDQMTGAVLGFLQLRRQVVDGMEDGAEPLFQQLSVLV